MEVNVEKKSGKFLLFSAQMVKYDAGFVILGRMVANTLQGLESAKLA